MFPLARYVYKGIKRLLKRKAKAKRVKKAPKLRLSKRAITRNVLVVKKVSQIDPIMINYGTNQGISTFFQLAQLQQYQCYIDLYEQFKIIKMVVKYRVLNNVNLGGTINNFNTAGMIHSQVDYNDVLPPGTTLANINTMMQDDTYKGTPSTRDHIRVMYPKYVETTDPTNNQKSTSGWLNTKNANGTINNSVFFGLKTIFQAGYSSAAGSANYMVIPQYTYYFAFKDPR